MVSIEDIENGLAAYLDSELGAQFPEGTLQRALLGGSIAFAVKRFGNKLRTIRSDKTAQMFDLFNENGEFDIDEYCNCLKPTIPETGVHFDNGLIGKITITKADVDKVREHILKQKEGATV